MSESAPLPLDRVRAYVEGTLSPPERAAFASEIAADRELAEVVQEYADVYAATDDPAPACALSAADLVLDDAVPAGPRWLARLGSPRIAAAAAFLLVAGAAVAWFATRPEAPYAPQASVVALDEIPLGDSPFAFHASPPLTAAEALAALSDYAPSKSGALHFLTDLDEARGVAFAVSRPLLVFVYHPTCPWCNAMAKGPFHDPAVAAAAEPFVLVKLDVTKIDQELVSGFQFWPIFWIENPKRERKHSFGDEQTATSLVRELTVGAAAAPLGEGVLAWATAREAARALSDSGIEPARRYAALLAAASPAAANAQPVDPLRADAAAKLESLRADALAAVTAARAETARGGVPAGLASLDTAMPRFAGTPIGRDLDAVRAALGKDGVFPTLTRKKATAPGSSK